MSNKGTKMIASSTQLLFEQFNFLTKDTLAEQITPSHSASELKTAWRIPNLFR